MVNGKCSLSDVNVIIFMRCLGNSVLNVQSKDRIRKFWTHTEKDFVKYALKGMTAYVILRQVA